MSDYVIVEVADGHTVVELEPGQSAQEAALANHGILANDLIYPSFEDASDALADFAILDEPELE
jgi:hypothetical protein